MFGYKEFNQWDKTKEKKLLKTTTRGVVKLFNSIFEFRKKEKEKMISLCFYQEKITKNYILN